MDIESPLPRIHTDPVLLERAVANLVDNALIHGGGSRAPGRGRAGGRQGGHPDHRPRPGDPPPGPRPGVPTVPAPRGLGEPASASAWGWRWPAVSSRRWAGASTSRTPPAAAAPWWSGSPSGARRDGLRRTVGPADPAAPDAPDATSERSDPGAVGPSGSRGRHLAVGIGDRSRAVSPPGPAPADRSTPARPVPRCWCATTTPPCCGPSPSACGPAATK